jgi:3-methyladenine DNA glycosylase AlkD
MEIVANFVLAIREQLVALTDPKQAAIKARFFKTGVGEYGEGSRFLGIYTADLQAIAKSFSDLPFAAIQVLLQSDIHEERLVALFILVKQYKMAEPMKRQAIYDFYMDNLQYINNWDLVDDSAHHIVGFHLLESDKTILITLAQSQQLWERRIAMVATLYFIRKHQFDWTIKIATMLVYDTHDLIQKAVGWMLREMGKKDEERLRIFLETYAATMPRTMLRYAIERFPADVRTFYLKQKTKDIR